MFTANLLRGTALITAVLLVGVLAGSQPAIANLGDCSQPVSTGADPVATDCLFVLRVAVGLLACTPQDCVCDPTGNGATTASDALTCLRKTVGEAIALLCPCIVSDCTNNGNCSDDDCVCSDCDDDLFCSNPDSCNHDDICIPFLEGCACADCATHPECLDN